MRRAFLIAAAMFAASCASPRDGDRRDARPSGDGEPGLVEACTAQAPGATGFDDDFDGAIDEGCPLFVGEPSPLAELHRTPAPLLSPWISRDKRRLYLVAGATGELVLATRASRDSPFEPPLLAARWDGVAITAATLSSDEHEIIVALADAPLARATRGDRGAPFGPLEPIALTAAPPHFHPSLSRDGRELYFVAADPSGLQRVHRAVRAAPGAPFEPAIAVLASDGATDELTPSTTEDGLLLFFSLGGALAQATRLADGSFGTPTLLGPAGLFPVAELRTRELFFVTDGAPWAPVPVGAVWRAPICRDTECMPRPIECEGGTRSADGQHCYLALRTPLPWPDARDDCAARGAHLATVASPDEAALLVTLLPDGAQWTGGFDAQGRAPECSLEIAPEGCAFRWIDDSPWLFAAWAAGEPSGAGVASERADCAALQPDATLDDRGCADALPFVCERERMPTW